MARGRQLAPARAHARAGSPALRLLPSGRSLAVGFGLLAAGFALYAGARQTSVFAVASIEVATEPAGHARVVRRALEPLVGTTLLEIDEAHIERRLDQLPHVHLLGYDRAFPDGLRVRVSVERPVAVLRQGSDRWLVSAERRVLRKLDRRLRRPLPVIWITRSVEPVVGAVLTEAESAHAVDALAAIRSADTTFARSVWYVKTGELDPSLTLVLRDGFELRLGDALDLPVKVAVAQRVLAELHASNDSATYLDLSVPARPVAGVDSQVSG